MPKLNPYLRFNDEKCKEAMTFYKECIGGELTFQTIGETPMAQEMPKEDQNRIMHASLKKGDFELFGSDMMRDKAVVGDNVVLSINCESEAEIKTLFEKLSAGGEVFMPLEKQFWGALFGVITDKFGFEWMLNYPMEPEK
ncbi:MAG: VOC family protein [Parcubacteria group bacterium]|nr:VOC family protein [Parcubacteria group bacterium]